jgi:hypothetical protein
MYIRVVDFRVELEGCMLRLVMDPERLPEILPVSDNGDISLRARIIPRNDDDNDAAPVPAARAFSREKLGMYARWAGGSFMKSVSASPLSPQIAAFGAPGSVTGRRPGGMGIRLPRGGKP